MQLTYRGQTYQSSPVALPTIIAKQELLTTYRGIPTTVKRYEFKVEKLENPNWRTMRFRGKRYVVAVPSLSFA